MYGCIYGLIRSYTVSHSLVQLIAHTIIHDHDIHASFLRFKNYTRLEQIHSNGPGVTPWLVRLYVRFTTILAVRP